MPMDRLAAYVARYGMTTVWIEDFRTTAQIRPSFPAPAGLLRDTMLGFRGLKTGSMSSPYRNIVATINALREKHRVTGSS